MPDFYVTFGAQYPRVPNPVWSPAHHNGWLRVRGAPDRSTAESWCWTVLLDFWSNIYDHEPSPAIYPLGEIGRMTHRQTSTGEVLTLEDAREYLGRPARRLADAALSVRTTPGADPLSHASPEWVEFTEALGAWYLLRVPMDEVPVREESDA